MQVFHITITSQHQINSGRGEDMEFMHYYAILWKCNLNFTYFIVGTLYSSNAKWEN